MGLGRELRLHGCLRLDLAEKNMPEQEMGSGGIRVVFEVLADGVIRVCDLALLEKCLRVRERIFSLDQRLRWYLSSC